MKISQSFLPLCKGIKKHKLFSSIFFISYVVVIIRFHIKLKSLYFIVFLDNSSKILYFILNKLDIVSPKGE
ncbi:hypothetical protein Q73_16710 [Bacillus coahuilensis m2-6]|nr:hypothetical protein Q73_16710 [Bacillus coahuilensis m2-6]